MSLESIQQDLAPFADLGTGAPRIVSFQRYLVCHLTREGVKTELVIDEAGGVVERVELAERRHESFKALLASPNFANLGKWADSQTVLLRDRIKEEDIDLSGKLSGENVEGGIALLDDSLTTHNTNPNLRPRVAITLIDGPAGIGKTSLIRLLSFRRASEYRFHQRALVLHVESRGRVLQNITDLMAFSLQTLRLNVTYDQIPVLVRNGLITLAVDGFDELGDPNGYRLAWAQVNDLIVSSRGEGVLLLSGRETFIKLETMERALSAFDRKYDKIQAFTLDLIKPMIARNWLREKTWTSEQLSSEAAVPLFEDGSYALRPFFISELSRRGVAEQIEAGDIEDLLSFLVNAMVKREASKFGSDIEAITSVSTRMLFVQKLMEEIARDLAENQTDSIPSESIAWLAEVVAYRLVPSELVGIITNRAEVIAFLTEDDRRGYKRFVHEQIQNYFLSKVTISSIIDGELPKYVRRNIFGFEFLENFCDVARHADQESIDRFSTAIVAQLSGADRLDRSKRNLGALLFSICSVAKPTQVPVIRNLNLDEIYVTESVCLIEIENTSINQLYARSADLRRLSFSNDCFIVSMIADQGTIPPKAFLFQASLPFQETCFPLQRIRRTGCLYRRIPMTMIIK